MTVAEAPERSVPKLLPYYLAQATAIGSLASVIALLGDIRDTFALSETRVGLIVGAGFFTAFVTQLTLARLADRGYAPIMTRVGLVAAAASMIGFAFADTFWEFVVARGVLGIAVGLAQPAVRRTVILADPEQTGRNIGRLGVAEVIGFALAPVFAALLAEVGSLDLPFYVMAAIILGVTIGTRTLVSDEGAQSEEIRAPFASFATVGWSARSLSSPASSS